MEESSTSHQGAYIDQGRGSVSEAGPWKRGYEDVEESSTRTAKIHASRKCPAPASSIYAPCEPLNRASGVDERRRSHETLNFKEDREEREAHEISGCRRSSKNPSIPVSVRRHRGLFFTLYVDWTRMETNVADGRRLFYIRRSGCASTGHLVKNPYSCTAEFRLKQQKSFKRYELCYVDQQILAFEAIK